MRPPADIAWSRQLSGTSTGQLVLWTTAGLLMLGAHAGAAWWVMRAPPEPMMQEAGSAAIEVDLAALGFTSANQVSAGDVGETAEPVTSETAQPVTETTEAEPVEQAAETPPPPTTARPTEARPEEAREVPAQLVEETPPSDVSIAAANPIPQPGTVEPVEATPVPVEEIEPVEENDELAALVNVPLPTPRPDYTPAATPRPERPRERAERPRERTEQPQRRQVQRQAGSAGQNQTDTHRGVADGSNQGQAERRTSQGQRSTAAGNAAVSNYPGKVASKLRRSLRYPAEARRARVRGEVHVSFSVSKSGGVGSVRIARSSGSPILDNAAIETVQRAAPFPPIPDAAGRSSWPFTVPLAFTR